MTQEIKSISITKICMDYAEHLRKCHGDSFATEEEMRYYRSPSTVMEMLDRSDKEEAIKMFVDDNFYYIDSINLKQLE